MRSFYQIAIVPVILSLIAYPGLAHEDIGVKAQAFGGAYRAVADSEDIIFSNPAGLIKHRRTAFDFFYQFATDAGFHRLGVAVGDAETTSWGLGVGYYAGIDNKTDRAANHLVHIAMAMPIVNDMFALGVSGSYFYDQAIISDPYSHFFNMDAAFMVNVPLGLSFAVVADHIIAPKGREKSLGLSVASAFELKNLVESLPLTLSIDWLMDDVKNEANLKHVFAAGMQYTAFNIMPLRLGYKSELTNKDTFLSLSAGILSDGFMLDGVYQQHLTIGKIRHFGVSIGWRI